MIKNLELDPNRMADSTTENSISCEERLVDLSAYYDGELDGDSHNEMEIHLNGCQACRETLSEMSRLSTALHSMVGNRGPQKSLLDEIMMRVKAEEDNKLLS